MITYKYKKYMSDKKCLCLGMAYQKTSIIADQCTGEYTLKSEILKLEHPRTIDLIHIVPKAQN